MTRHAPDHVQAREAAPPSGGRMRPIPLILLCAAQAMLIVDVVVVNVALPSIRADLHIPDARIQLVSVGYTLTFGSLLIVFGRAGDLLGRRRVFLLGLAVFTLTSLATGMAQTEWQLVAARAGQGVGAAMIAPTALALLTTTFAEGAARNRALGYWAAVGSAGAIGGQVLGGLITETLGWRWVFLINVPIGVLAILAARRVLVESRAERKPLDVVGATLLVAGLACATLALMRFGEGDGTSVAVIVAAGAACALVAFGLVERRHPAPILDRRLLRVGTVVHANALLAINAGALGATLFFTTLYMQVVLGYSALHVGLAFAPITLLILLLSPRVGALLSRHGVRRPLLGGFILLAAGMLLLARVPADGRYLRDVLPPLLLLAFGSALSYAPMFVAGTAGVSDEDQGLTSGLLNSAQELGTAVGVTVFGAIATAATVGTGAVELAHGYRFGLLAAAAVTLAGLLLVRFLPGPAVGGDRPEA